MAIVQTNLPIVDMDATIEYFSQVYDQPIELTQNVIDAIFAFFIARTENEETAHALVYTVIATALESAIDPMAMLDRFKGLDEYVLDAELATFLNLSRNPSSMLGVLNTPQVNNQISRTILS